MIRIPKVSKDVEKRFLEEVFDAYKQVLDEHLKSAKADDKIKKFFAPHDVLVKDRIKSVLVGKKAKLLEAIKAIGVIKKKRRKASEVKAGENTETISDKFTSIYDSFIKTELGKTLSQKLNVDVCPYCNRSYTYTVVSKNVRPQYDHFFCKSKYPYLAVSLYNLIPSCAVCNQAKGAKDVYDEQKQDVKILYPHEQDFGYDVHFATSCSGDITYLLGATKEFNLKIDSSSAPSKKRNQVETANQFFSLEDLYNLHKEHVQRTIKLAYMYDSKYVEYLLTTFPNLFRSKEELEDAIFQTPLRREDWGKQVLAKLDYDMIMEFRRV